MGTYDERFLIYLILIVTRELGVIEEIERVDMFFVKIVWRHKQVRARTPSGVELPAQPDVRS